VGKVYRIGLCLISSTLEWTFPEPQSPQAKALLRGLSDLGYLHGKHYVTEARGASGQPERYPLIAAELVALQPDVIVGAGPTLPALKRATGTLPIVMSAAIDPVAEGLVQSLGRPGTNFTGLSHQYEDTAPKRLELLKDLVPGAAPVAVLWDRGTQWPWRAVQAAARSRGWKLHSLEINDAAELEAAFKSAAAARAGGMLVLTGQVAFPNRQRIVELAARHRLPAMYDLRPYVAAGGLISYGAELNDIWRHAARFVDKLLKGAKPADLPVEQPTRFELILNLKAATALGLKIPNSLRARIDEVIE
jgi:putative tryptophan/tyrosine transport system substrate-binding protein